MKQFIFLICFSFSNLGYCLNDFKTDIIITIEILDETENINQSSSSGDLLLEYKGYYFYDIISNITNVPLEYFSLGNKVDNPLVNFKAVSKEKIENKDLKKALIIFLKEKMDVDLQIIPQKKLTRVIYFTDKFKVKKNKCKENFVESSVTIINRTLKAKCIKTDILVSKISEWYNIQIVNELDSMYNYNFEIHHSNSLEELILELNYYYSINIKSEPRNVQTLLMTTIKT